MSRGFTLIELLVVITIIVVLLALLTPALDKAIYQAELAVCGAQVGGVAKGVNIYAMDFKRSYPYRRYVATGQSDETSVYPWLLRNQGAGGMASSNDDRAPLKGYVDMKSLVDPLCEMVDLNERNSWIYSSYNLWFGWNYKGEQGMTKVGNRLEWTDTYATPPKSYSVNWLITDGDNPGPLPKFVLAGHPDDLGLMHNLAVEAGEKDDPSPEAQVVGLAPGSETGSRWVWWEGWDRGEIEMNAAAADGSVSRYNDVPTFGDERMAFAPKCPAAKLTRTASPARDGTVPDAPQNWINVPRQ